MPLYVFESDCCSKSICPRFGTFDEEAIRTTSSILEDSLDAGATILPLPTYFDHAPFSVKVLGGALFLTLCDQQLIPLDHYGIATDQQSGEVAWRVCSEVLKHYRRRKGRRPYPISLDKPVHFPWSFRIVHSCNALLKPSYDMSELLRMKGFSMPSRLLPEAMNEFILYSRSFQRLASWAWVDRSNRTNKQG